VQGRREGALSTCYEDVGHSEAYDYADGPQKHSDVGLKTAKQLQHLEKLKRHAHFSSSASALPHGHFKTSELDPGRVVFYKKGLLIDHIYYICEISYNQQGFFISLYAVETPTVSICLHLKHNAKTDQIMKRVNYNFDMLAHSLKIKGGRIYIDKNLGGNEDIYGVYGSERYTR